MKTDSVENKDANWKGLYKIAGVTTLVLMVFFLFDIIIWGVFGPYPVSAEGWFRLLQENKHVGLLLLSLPTLFGMVLYYLTFLSLYHILRQTNSSFAALAVLFAFIGLTILLITNMVYPIVYLSKHYALTTTETERVLLLAAGETKIATAITGVNMGGFLVEGAAVLFSLLMLRSTTFSKLIAYLGIVGHGLDFIRIIMNLLFLPEDIAAILLMIGGLPQLIWLILVARKFLQLGQSVSESNLPKVQ
jgi:hypothetical protein